MITTKALREKILDLAMRGKLVPQDPTDEPASVLLDKIKEEKEQLIKDKKIKKEKPLPKISKEEIPYDIPENWKWTRLSDISKELFAGGDKPRNFAKEKTNEFNIPIYANGMTKNGLYGYTNIAKVTERALTISARGTIGYSVIRNEPFVPIVRLIVVIPIKEYVDLTFVKCLFEHIIENGEGTSIKQLTIPKIKPRLIPLPPTKEQKRIVAKIEMIREVIQRIDFE
ncbi:restriction endonuclease subunit S [Enterococcus faecium]|uniref:restriction endonuclease subunit S n=1 Tax=Enterococcus faecium TaxID=1352 RepID=UPI0017828DAE|nr:restriction endonuclease subunit S [Enterococcus faecium]MBD9837245.1 restriction endonuclease subunit S [Enterococcus faecium]